jgi:methionyl-tRNA formyltransferase
MSDLLALLEKFSPPKQYVVIGTGRLAASCVEILDKTGIKGSAIETDPTNFSPLEAACRNLNIQYELSQDKSEILEKLNQLPDKTIVISAYNSYIFPKEIVHNPKLLILNFHNSLLPRHRGRNAPTWAIASGDKVTGITWHLVSEEIDDGDIVFQKEIRIDLEDSGLSLTRKTLDVGSESFREIQEFFFGTQKISLPINKNQNAEENPLHTSRDVPKQGKITTELTVEEIYNLLRSVDFGPISLFPPIRFINEHGEFEITKYSSVFDSAEKPEFILLETDSGVSIEISDGHKSIRLEGKNVSRTNS